jgi:hypothetical protein
VDQLALFNVIDHTPLVATVEPGPAPVRVPKTVPDWRLGFVLLDMVDVAGLPNWSDPSMGAGVIVGFNDQTQMVDVDLSRPDGKAHIYTVSPSRLTKILDSTN